MTYSTTVIYLQNKGMALRKKLAAVEGAIVTAGPYVDTLQIGVTSIEVKAEVEGVLQRAIKRYQVYETWEWKDL